MPDSPETIPLGADRSLLFGILAWQMDFITHDALLQALHAWVLGKMKPLGQRLVEAGALRPDNRDLLEALVQRHLEMHGGNPQQSLAALRSIGPLRRDLMPVADAELRASLAALSAAGEIHEIAYDPDLSSLRVVRWVRRYQTAAVAAWLLLMVAAGLTVGLYIAKRENDVAAQRQAAEQASAEARAVLDFFQNQVLAAARPEDPQGDLGVPATIRAAVADAEPKIAAAFRRWPLVEASIRNTVGWIYRYLGEDQAAIAPLERALALRHEHLGPNHPDTLASMSNVAAAYQGKGDFAEAERIWRECLTIRQQKEPDDWRTFHTQSLLGGSLLGQKHYGKAEPLIRAGYEGLKQRQARIPANEKKLLTEALNRLVQLYDAWGKPDEAGRWRTELAKLPRPLELPKGK